MAFNAVMQPVYASEVAKGGMPGENPACHSTRLFETKGPKESLLTDQIELLYFCRGKCAVVDANIIKSFGMVVTAAVVATN